MQYYGFNPRKFKFETHNLEPLERLVYRELIDEYMAFEKPLTTNVDDLAWRMGYKSEELKQALKLVLDKFFAIKTLKKTGDQEPMYHHPRLDGVLFSYWKNNPNENDKGKTTNKTTNKSTNTTNATTNTTNATTNELQTTTNDTTNKNSTDTKKAFLIESLKKQGIKANTRMRIGELQTLFDEHCKQPTNTTNATTNELQTTTNASTNDTNVFLAGENHKPITNNQKPIVNNTPLTPQGGNAGDSEQVATDETYLQTNHTDTQTKQTTDQTSSSSRQSKPSAKSKSDTKPKFDPKSYPLDNAVDDELWCDFVDMRQAIKKPLTEQACKLLVKEFKAWIEKGLSPNLAISASIKNSWQGVFESHASPANLPQHRGANHAWQPPPQPPVRDFAKATAEIEMHGNPILLNLQRAFGVQPPQPINVTPQEINHE